MVYQELNQRGMVNSLNRFPCRCNEIARESEQPTADLVIASAKDDALRSFKNDVEYVRDKVRNS
jgi:hypothetical protein